MPPRKHMGPRHQASKLFPSKFRPFTLASSRSNSSRSRHTLANSSRSSRSRHTLANSSHSSRSRHTLA
ncbi:MAG: hypothetical protein FWH40_02915, partial [Coriobacteriia bacterium]|nr:hypothetical protein [Coriobacteriia bacterium]